jgi:hypothetical protein
MRPTPPVFAFFVTVRAWNKVGLMTERTSDGVQVLVQPPIAGVVLHGLHLMGTGKEYQSVGYTTSLSELESTWVGFTDLYGHQLTYEVRVGTSAFPDRIAAFTAVGSRTNFTMRGLTLAHGLRYFVGVRASNCAGLMISGTSDGIVLDTSPPIAGRVRFTRTGSEAHLSTFAQYVDGRSTRAFQSIREHASIQWEDWVDPESDIMAFAVALRTSTKTTVDARGNNSVPEILDLDDAEANIRWRDFAAADGMSKFAPVSLTSNNHAFNFVKLHLLQAASGKRRDLTGDNGWRVYDDWGGLQDTLNMGYAYVAAVKGTNHAGLSSEGASNLLTIDTSSPIKGTVTHTSGRNRATVTECQMTTVVAATWTGFADPESGVASVEWSIGTSAGMDNVVNSTTVVGGVNWMSYEVNSTLWKAGTYMFVNVRATNAAGGTTPVSSSGVQLLRDSCPADYIAV